MTYKQIEMARETRLWIAQIFVPAAVAAAAALSVPEIRCAVANKFRSAKDTIKNKFKKDA